MNDPSLNRHVSPLVTAALAVGLLMGVGFTVLNAMHSSGPVMTPYQPDSLIYYQYGRAFSEGHAYRLTAEQDPSTGSTSHLYPAVLGMLYAIGARGDWLGLASFLLGVVSLTLSLVCVTWIVRSLDERAGWLALALCALSGQLMLSVLGESDISLFTPLALGAFASALYGRTVWLSVCLGLAALCRPEGMVLSGLLFGGSLVWCLFRREDRWARAYLVAGAIGLLGATAALMLNLVLTGSPSFQSVNLKGYFADFPLVGAIQHTVRDLARVFLELAWGVSEQDRSLYVMPVVGGVLAAAGLLSRRWTWTRARFCEGWFLAGILASILLVSTSGYQGLMTDRYFGWWMPVFLIYVASGLYVVTGRMHGQVKWTLGLALIGFQAVSMTYFASTFIGRNLIMASEIEFTRNLHQQLSPEKSIGMYGRIGLVYYLPGRSVVNVSGIASPAFIPRVSVVESVEMLKHQPDLRFDCWLLSKRMTEVDWLKPMLGDTLMVDTMAPHPVDATGAYLPRWEVLDGAQNPLNPEVLQAVSAMRMVDSLDVGYGPDEVSHERTVFTRLPSTKLKPFAVALAREDEGTLLEVGELVIGSETFTLATEPGQTLRLVMRTLRRAEVQTAGAMGEVQSNTYELGDPLRLIVQVDGRQTEIMKFALDPATDRFDEIVMEIPGELITGERSRVTVGGDHISCAFWAYQ